MVDTKMDALGWLRKQVDGNGNDMTREMVKTFAEFLMSSGADARCGASHGVRSPDRVNSRNGYRQRARSRGRSERCSGARGCTRRT